MTNLLSKTGRLNFLHFIGHPKRGKLPIKKGEENGNNENFILFIYNLH